MPLPTPWPHHNNIATAGDASASVIPPTFVPMELPHLCTRQTGRPWAWACLRSGSHSRAASCRQPPPSTLAEQSQGQRGIVSTISNARHLACLMNYGCVLMSCMRFALVWWMIGLVVVQCHQQQQPNVHDTVREYSLQVGLHVFACIPWLPLAGEALTNTSWADSCSFSLCGDVCTTYGATCPSVGC